MSAHARSSHVSKKRETWATHFINKIENQRRNGRPGHPPTHFANGAKVLSGFVKKIKQLST
jgi:hypothetical protein